MLCSEEVYESSSSGETHELLFKALLFAVVKMASFPGCLTFIPQNLGSWGEKGQLSCHQMETCTQWRKQPTGISWKSMIQCWVLHMGRQNMQKYRPPTYRTVLRAAQSVGGGESVPWVLLRNTLITCSEVCSTSRREYFGGRTQTRADTSEEITEKMELWSSQQCMAGG